MKISYFILSQQQRHKGNFSANELNTLPILFSVQIHDIPLKCGSRTQFSSLLKFTHSPSAASSLRLLGKSVVITKSWLRIPTSSLHNKILNPVDTQLDKNIND